MTLLRVELQSYSVFGFKPALSVRAIGLSAERETSCLHIIAFLCISCFFHLTSRVEGQV